jgi:hypothetical protein
LILAALYKRIFVRAWPVNRRHWNIKHQDGIYNSHNFSLPFGSSGESFSVLFFERSSFAASAVNPPVDITLPIINAALAMHAGHIELLLQAKTSLRYSSTLTQPGVAGSFFGSNQAFAAAAS